MDVHLTLCIAHVYFLVHQKTTQNSKVLSPDQPKTRAGQSQSIPSPRKEEQEVQSTVAAFHDWKAWAAMLG